jgi:thiol:disulfide interchange protein DsbC
MKSIKPLWTLLVSLGWLATAWADPVLSPDAMKARMLVLYPATHIDTVMTTEMPGIYEVAMGRNIVYVEQGGKYFLFGHLFDLRANRDLTEERIQALSKVDASLINAAQTLTDPARHGKVVYVFSDPQCGYCRQLEKTLAGMPDLDARIVPLPLQRGSMTIAENLLCAPDRLAAWSDWMLKSVAPAKASATCKTEADDVLKRNLALATQYGIRATPGLVAGDGRLSVGAMSAHDLTVWLTQATTPVPVTEVVK